MTNTNLAVNLIRGVCSSVACTFVLTALYMPVSLAADAKGIISLRCTYQITWYSFYLNRGGSSGTQTAQFDINLKEKLANFRLIESGNVAGLFQSPPRLTIADHSYEFFAEGSLLPSGKLVTRASIDRTNGEFIAVEDNMSDNCDLRDYHDYKGTCILLPPPNNKF